TEPARALEAEEAPLGGEVELAVGAEANAAGSRERHGAGERQVGEPGAVPRAGVAHAEAAVGAADLGVSPRHAGRAQRHRQLGVAAEARRRRDRETARRSVGAGAERHLPARELSGELGGEPRVGPLCVGDLDAATDGAERGAPLPVRELGLVGVKGVAELAVGPPALALAGEGRLHLIQVAALLVGARRALVVLEHLPGAAGVAVLAGLLEEERGLLDPLAVARGGRALRTGALHQRAAQ